MKKFLKIVMALFIVGTCVFAGNQVEAAVIYNKTANSNTHTNGRASQFFKVDAEMKQVGNSSTMNSYTSRYYKSGEGSFSNSPVLSDTEDTYYKFDSTSTIYTSMNGLSSKPLSATIYR